MRTAIVVGLIGAGLLLAGCGAGAVSGEADPEGVAAGEPVFSPCDDIPDDAVRSLGFDPTTKEWDVMGVKQPGWNICGWMGAGPSLSVFATNRSLDDVRANQKNTEFTPVDLEGRSGFSYREIADTDRRSCDVAVGVSGGAVLVSVSYLGVDAVVEDPCLIATRATRELVGYMPT